MTQSAVYAGDPITVEHADRVALVRVDNPPVNALGTGVRSSLVRAVEQVNAQGLVDVVAIYCAGRTFVAGADITEFGKPPVPPGLQEVLAAT